MTRNDASKALISLSTVFANDDADPQAVGWVAIAWTVLHVQKTVHVDFSNSWK